MRGLDGRTVALLESRKSGELAAMVQRLGGIAVAVPAVRELPTTFEVEPLIERLVAGEFRVMVVLTAAGITALLTEADRRGARDAVLAALRNMTVVCRGPKPQAVFRRFDLTAVLTTNRPHTSEELLDTLAGVDLVQAATLLLHYGERNEPLAAALRARGARLEDACLYEWAMPDDLAPLRQLVGRIVRHEIDAVAFTSQIQFRFLAAVAADMGAHADLMQALNRHVIVAAVGPVCASVLRAGGVIPDVMPASPNSASLIGALADYFTLTAPVKEPIL